MAKDRVLGSEFEKPIETVEQYKFEPIKGYPMLYWQGKRPFESTQYYPAQLKETYGEESDGWFNRIYWGDNLQVMSHLLKEFRGQVDLIYIDPPFDSKAVYKKKVKLRDQKIANDQNAFEEKQYTDIWTNDEYLQFMYERLILLRELLSDKGSIMLHCDWHKAHYLRCILDELFGADNFKNEIIWHYRTGNLATKQFQRKHDNILFYTKSSESYFQVQKVKEYYFCLYGPGLTPSFQGPNDAEDEYGLYKISDVDDVWDISAVFTLSNEHISYPTQKPEALLDRIVAAASKPGDLILDTFMGTGTAMAVAMKSGRRFIGADINLGAIQITTKRLISIAKNLEPVEKKLIDEGETHKFTGFQVYNVNHYDFFRNEVEAKDLLIKALEVEPLPSGSLFDGQKDGRVVKIMPVGRIATRADLNELITGFDQKTFEKRFKEFPNKPVERITLVCMGHEPSLAADLKKEMLPYKLDVEVVDILRDKANLELKRDSEAEIKRSKNKIEIKKFYPMNLLQKLSISKQNVGDWKELVESVMIDFNYDGAVLEPSVIDVPEGNAVVKGEYEIPSGSGTIRVKITDLLSESLEVTVDAAN